ncbi:MAG TPA: carboxypeptidase regulatory-like domain-containing protein, partial [Kofleriaceae bacterium]|nr:carboxypeptidase regulatory-like domain-containing protein [Kofleriaceae bacterium]
MKRRIVVGLACVAIVAIAIWWWHGHRSSTADATASGRDHQATPTERAPQREGDVRSGALPPLVDDDPRGSLRLEGQVVDATNHPIEGAIVGLSSSPPRTTTSEGDGTFVFDGLVARRYTLTARAKEGVAGPVTATLTPAMDPIVMRLRAGGTVVVQVVGPDAKPISGSTVELRGLDNQSAPADKGTVTFAPVVPGMYELVAWAPGMARAYQTARVTGETRIRIMLAPGAGVEGRVVDEHGAGISGARVLSSPAGEFRPQGDARLDAVMTGADGGFSFDALPAGSFRFGATHPDHAPGQSPLVTLDGASKKTGVTVTMSTGALVRGHVVDATKQPVVGARVRIVEGGPGQRGGGR